MTIEVVCDLCGKDAVNEEIVLSVHANEMIVLSIY